MTTKTPNKTPDRLHELLRKSSNMSVSQLAELAGMGRSTVGKALIVLESQGLATRVAGTRDGAKRLPDLWSAVVEQVTVDEGNSSQVRLGRGELRAQVVEYLQAHANESFTSSALGKVLQRSSGAIGNALIRLTKDGVVVQTNDQPRRYAFSDDS